VKSHRTLHATSRGEWYFVHVLAGLTIAEVALLGMANIYFSLEGEPSDLPMPMGVVLGVGVVALLWFWIRMLSDFFRERPPSHQTAWGWFLILGMYFGGLAYFFSVWRPRHRANDT
jgi:hypothetical protein